MSQGEFDLIARHFTFPASIGRWPSEGVGDDCALIRLPERTLAVTTDMMAVGTHFLPDVSPRTMGRKALAVNLSDLAAAGAEPRAFFLSISLPERDDAWLAEFRTGLLEMAEHYGCALLGGDTVKAPDGAPVSLSITAVGEMPAGEGLTRAGARVGDDVWLTGTTGDAYAALMIRTKVWKDEAGVLSRFAPRMDDPTPRVAVGCALRRFAHAAVDVSDGLLQDLGHILERSGTGAVVAWDACPKSEALRAFSEEACRRAVLGGGDDYELLFCAAPEDRARVETLARVTQVPLTRIGRIVERGLRVVDREGEEIPVGAFGFDHFAS